MDMSRHFRNQVEKKNPKQKDIGQGQARAISCVRRYVDYLVSRTRKKSTSAEARPRHKLVNLVGTSDKRRPVNGATVHADSNSESCLASCPVPTIARGFLVVTSYNFSVSPCFNSDSLELLVEHSFGENERFVFFATVSHLYKTKKGTA